MYFSSSKFEAVPEAKNYNELMGRSNGDKIYCICIYEGRNIL